MGPPKLPLTLKTTGGPKFTQNKDPNFKSYGRTLYGLPLDNPTL